MKNKEIKEDKMKKQKSEEVLIKDLRCKHINQEVVINGRLIKASNVRPQVISAKFECPSCGTIMSVLQLDKKFREPSHCSCGEKWFKEISKDFVDAQRITIAQGKKFHDKEYGYKVESDRMNIFLKDNLCDPKYKILDRIGFTSSSQFNLPSPHPT